ncbi:MAG: IS701 family transposase [Chloroflexota bacterium]|nr:IS701 family transposase [Chloroflexota bacterium]
MTKRQAVPPAPGPLEEYAVHFDVLFGKANQRAAYRRYVEGLLLPAERNKTLTALANVEPIIGAQRPEAQSLQWFLSESTWDLDAVNRRRLELLRADPLTAPTATGVLVIDEHGDRKWGHATAHIGKQYLANLGKIDTGVVSVTSLFADAGVYYPLHVTPYTPAHHFEQGKSDPKFRTKLAIARELVDAAVQAGVSFRAVVADCFYGEDEELKCHLRERSIGSVLALKPSHAWWHQQGKVGSLREAAEAASWTDAEHPGDWVRVVRHFRDGHTEDWWALEVTAGPYGPEQAQRAIVATTDPATLPEHTTWYLVTTLPAPGSARAAAADALPAAELAELVWLYGLRNWVEQSYKQTRGSLGWSQYQVRFDLAIRRHWQLVCCAFSFCWYHHSQLAEDPAAAPCRAEPAADAPVSATDAVAERGGNERLPDARLMAGRPPAGAELVGALDHAVALLARVVERAPATGAAAAA